MSDSSKDGLVNSDHRAMYACGSCRKQKKGCDKALPACSACVRLKRNCKYGPDIAPAPSEDYEDIQRRLSCLEKEMYNRLSSSPRKEPLPSDALSGDSAGPPKLASTFPSAFFLDIEAYQEHNMKAQKPCLVVPDNILRAIGDHIEIQATIGGYFFSVSTWMGMVSRKKLHQDIPSNSIALDADVALLILCMKLVNDKVLAGSGDPRTNLYLMAKDYYRMVEISIITSVRLLQAGLLISLYEIGHAIYPEAFLTIGRAGRVGQAIGLHDTAVIPQLSLEPETWDDMEERRRVWWAVYILDRHVTIGNPTRTLALVDPQRDTYLPVHDNSWELNSWEQGDIVASQPLYLSSSTNIAAAPFARLGQATHLMSLVISLLNDKGCAPDLRLEEARQLAHALQALSLFLRGGTSKEATQICVPMATCFSALTTLYEHCAKTGQGNSNMPAGRELQDMANTGLDTLVPEMVTFATHVQMILPYNIIQASPLVANCFYRIAVRLSRKPNPDYPQAFHYMKETLARLGARWMVAAEYVKLLANVQPETPGLDLMLRKKP